MAVTGSTKNIQNDICAQKLIESKVRIASFSGAVYKCMLIAKGKLIGYVERGLNPHDIAASQVIIEGAGGRVTSLTGEKLDYTKAFKGVVVSNRVVHDKLVEYCK
jgi:fructose-1,6-bisphosphatase/inositol monophosphatase family enzyme